MGKAAISVFSGALLLGLFMSIGVDPQGLIIEALLQVVYQLNPPQYLSLFIVLGILLAIASWLNALSELIEIFQAGGSILISAICGFVSGLILVKSPQLGLFPLLIGLVAATFSDL